MQKRAQRKVRVQNYNFALHQFKKAPEGFFVVY
jgi:hypothetical protein